MKGAKFRVKVNGEPVDLARMFLEAKTAEAEALAEQPPYAAENAIRFYDIEQLIERHGSEAQRQRLQAARQQLWA